MKHYEATIKESNGCICHPSYIGDVDEAFLIEFWGLEDPDVEWYKIEMVSDDENTKQQ